MLKTVTNSINASQIQTPITLPGDVTLSTGNLVIGTSGKGIDFSATPGTGTSELLADYEEGTWTLNVASGAGSITTVGTTVGKYTKVGRLVTLFAEVTITDNGTGSNYLGFFGIPFVANASFSGFAGCGSNLNTGKTITAVTQLGTVYLRYYDASYPVATGEIVTITLTYQV